MRNYLIILAFLFSACVSEEYGAESRQEPEEVATRLGYVYVSGKGTNDPSFEATEHFKTVRTYVFNDVSDAATVEFKEFHDLTEYGEPVVGFDGMMSVYYNPSGRNNRKLIAVVVNEPKGMEQQFEAVNRLADLEALQIDMNKFLNDQHTAIDANKSMPMTGVLCTDKIYADTQSALDSPETIWLDRAAAKIEVWMTTDLPEGLNMEGGSYIKLNNTLDQSPLLYHSGGWRDVGTVQNPAAGYTTKTWSIPEDDPFGGGGAVGTETQVPQHTPVKVCTFYSPERLTKDRKLSLSIGMKNSEGLRTGTAEIEQNKQGVLLDTLRRNYTYKVTLNMKSTGILSYALLWQNEKIETQL